MNRLAQQQTKRSASRRRLFIVITISLPVVFLVAVELSLRQFDIGGYAPVLQEVIDTPRGKLVATSIAGVRNFFFANLSRPGAIGMHTFYSAGSANTLRIVLLGGSMIKGFPQSPRFSMSAYLGEMLGDVWPDREIEVINLGITAVASFPVREILRQVLKYRPDLVIIATGNNEFYGAYGVASSSMASMPAMLRLQYRLHELGIVQGLRRIMQSLQQTTSPSLMEVMVGQNNIAADSWKRQAAAGLLYEHVGAMIEMGHKQNVPVIVCTLPTNERDLVPIGRVHNDSMSENIIADARHNFRKNPEKVIAELTSLLQKQPDHARAHFYLGKAYFSTGNYQKARLHFYQARDLDPMPWRTTGESQQAIRNAVADHGGQLCEAEKVFREHSPGKAIGHELMDDHVHPSLDGQALLARTIVETLSQRNDALRVTRKRLDSLPSPNTYTRRLGDNLYERYAVAHTLRTLYTIPFMEESNPQALYHFNKLALHLENQMEPAIRDVAWQWHKTLPGGTREQPISAMVAGELLGQNRYQQALQLFDVARHSVDSFTTLNLDYTRHWLAIRDKLSVTDDTDRKIARQAITRAELLLQYDRQKSSELDNIINDLQRLGF